MKHAWIMTIAALCAACSSDPDIQPVPPSELLPTESEKPGNESGSRLRKIDRVGADGSREFAGWYDSERDEDCAFRKIDSVARCLPSAIEHDGRNYYPFLDDACARPLGSKEDIGIGRNGAPLRQYTLLTGEVFSETRPRLYLHGDVSAAGAAPQPEMAQVYLLSATDGCIPWSTMLNLSSVVFLEEVSFEEFVPWTEVVDGLGN